jgi:ABC-type Mn2+/Zn2+ transport system permease subunit
MGLFACSGEGAGALTIRNIEIGQTHAVLAGILLATALVMWRAQVRRHLEPVVCAVLFLLHPAWTISATGGDCGRLKRDLSWTFTGVGCAAVSLQLLTLMQERRRRVKAWQAGEPR